MAAYSGLFCNNLEPIFITRALGPMVPRATRENGIVHGYGSILVLLKLTRRVILEKLKEYQLQPHFLLSE